MILLLLSLMNAALAEESTDPMETREVSPENVSYKHR